MHACILNAYACTYTLYAMVIHSLYYLVITKQSMFLLVVIFTLSCQLVVVDTITSINVPKKQNENNQCRYGVRKQCGTRTKTMEKHSSKGAPTSSAKAPDISKNCWKSKHIF